MNLVSTRIAAFVVFWLALFGGPFGAFGQSAPAQQKGQEIPLHITALRLEADQAKRLITFSGQVKAQYGDSLLYANQLRVYYQSPESQKAAGPEKSPEASPLGDLGGEKVERIEAEGQVRFVQEDKVATGQKAIYYRDGEKVVLLGNPQVWRGENNLKGERITMHLKDNRVVVESSPQQRVEAHLYQAPGEGAKVGGILPGSRPSLKKASPQKKQKRP